MTIRFFKFLFAVISVLFLNTTLIAQNKTLTIELQEVDQSKVKVYSIAQGQNELIKDIASLKQNERVNIDIPQKYLPGEFILYFEFAGAPSASRPQQTERMIIINQKDLNFIANPLHINNPEKSYFKEKSIENDALTEFAMHTMQNLEMLDVLQSFLLKYNDRDSDFYKTGIKEFQKKRDEHNSWINEQLIKHKDLFCSNMFYFYYVPDVNWEGTAYERQKSLVDNYFTGMDFSKVGVLRTSYLKSWMDSYVNQYIELATSQEMYTALFVESGEKAIELSKKGAPYFYGWMVDYFFNGYEIMNIQEGIQMLEKYINDPNCMTYKKTEINKRISGIESLKNGVIAPDFTFTDESGTQSLHTFNTKAPYKLVLFWSADCDHCHALVEAVYGWQKNNKSKLEVFALSLDESDTEIPKWEVRIKELPGWNHVLTQGGINSKEAESYFILSTPTMFLVDAKTNKIVSSPMSFGELMEEIK